MDTSTALLLGFDFSNAEVQAAIISGFLSVIAGVAPSLVVYFTSLKYLSKKQAEGTALKAMQELQFYQAIESEAVANSDLTQRHLRKLVYENQELKSNHAFTPKLLEKKIAGYTARTEKTSLF